MIRKVASVKQKKYKFVLKDSSCDPPQCIQLHPDDGMGWLPERKVSVEL